MENLSPPRPFETKWVHDISSYTAIVDKDLNLIDASLGWFEHSHLKREHAIGKCIYELVEHFDENWEDGFEYALEGVGDIKLIQNTVKSNGGANSSVWHLNPWTDGYGNTIGLIITIKEERKKPSKFIDNASLRAIFENNKESIIASWEYRVDDGLMFWSNEFRNLLGLPYSVKPTLRKSLSFVGDSADKAMLNTAIKEAINSGIPMDLTLKIQDFNNKTQSLNLIGRPKFKDGKCVRILGVLQESIGSQKTNGPKENFRFQNRLFDYVPSNLVLIDLKTQSIVKVNRHLLNFFGKTNGFFTGKKIQDFIVLDREVKTVINESLKTRFGFTNVDVPFFHKNLGQYSFNVSGNLIFDSSGADLLLISCMDSTRTSEVEKSYSGNLRQANGEIEKMVHFAHMVSHDLKAHTTNLDLLLNFLTTEEDEVERKSLIQMLFQSTNNLTNTIKGLRELVAIKHQEHAKKKCLNLNDFVYKVIQSNNGIIKKKNAKIHNEIDDALEVKAIPAYLESILANLILNGLRFLNENERPVLILNAETKDDHTVLSIEDNSMGINLEKEGDNVFALYKNLKNMGGSTSMGLYLTKYQIELMGGRIEVESAEGEGNMFKVYFPM